MAEDSPRIQLIRERFPSGVLEVHAVRGEETVLIRPEGVGEFFRFLKEKPGLDFDFLTDITAVDYLGKKEPRFEVVYHLRSMQWNHRLRVKTPVSGESPEVDSLTPLWPGANWLEREVWDMYGIRFRGHPNLKRILLYEEFKGHPLRKDYPVNQRQPLVPERPLDGTFVDQRSDNKLAQLKQTSGR